MYTEQFQQRKLLYCWSARVEQSIIVLATGHWLQWFKCLLETFLMELVDHIINQTPPPGLAQWACHKKAWVYGSRVGWTPAQRNNNNNNNKFVTYILSCLDTYWLTYSTGPTWGSDSIKALLQMHCLLIILIQFHLKYNLMLCKWIHRHYRYHLVECQTLD